MSISLYMYMTTFSDVISSKRDLDLDQWLPVLSRFRILGYKNSVYIYTFIIYIEHFNMLSLLYITHTKVFHHIY